MLGQARILQTELGAVVLELAASLPERLSDLRLVGRRCALHVQGDDAALERGLVLTLGSGEHAVLKQLSASENVEQESSLGPFGDDQCLGEASILDEQIGQFHIGRSARFEEALPAVLVAAKGPGVLLGG